MTKKLLTLFFTFIFIMSLCPASYSLEDTTETDEASDYVTTMKQDMLVLFMSYPDYIKEIQKDNDLVYLVMKSDKKILYDDKKEKTHEEKLNNPDLQDMLEQIYPLEKTNKVMDLNFDPGRARNYDLLNCVYGSNKSQIQANLGNLKHCYTNYQFNKQNKALDSLDNVFKELMEKAKTDNAINSILYPASGTFNYRIISGTGRLSPHSYGLAIDLRSDKRDYWKWNTPKNAKSRLKEYPSSLVTTFENNNFIWGGKWGHFDILHFEYRPEIILKARYFASYDKNTDWYTGAPSETEEVMNYIKYIDSVL